jgi:hypothetical protein
MQAIYSKVLVKIKSVNDVELWPGAVIHTHQMLSQWC